MYTKLTLNILFSWSISDFPGKRGFIESNSPNMHPTDHISIGVEYCWKVDICIIAKLKYIIDYTKCAQKVLSLIFSCINQLSTGDFFIVDVEETLIRSHECFPARKKHQSLADGQWVKTCTESVKCCSYI